MISADFYLKLNLKQKIIIKPYINRKKNIYKSLMNYNVIGIIGTFLLGGEHLTSLVLKKESTKEEEKNNIIQFFVCLLGYSLIILRFILSEKKERERQREIVSFTAVRLRSLLELEIKILSDINSGKQEEVNLIGNDFLILYKRRRDLINKLN